MIVYVQKVAEVTKSEQNENCIVCALSEMMPVGKKDRWWMILNKCSSFRVGKSVSVNSSS